MKQTLLLIMMALGMCSINGNAQPKKPIRTSTQAKAAKTFQKDSREYQVGDDGFEWYRVCKNGKFGAEDKNGKVLVPIEYKTIDYESFNYNEVLTTAYGAGFKAYMGNYIAYYLQTGKCILPYSRKYTFIYKYYHDARFGTIYLCKTENGCAVCDVNGKEILSNSNYTHAEPQYDFGRFYYSISMNGLNGIADGNGKIVISPNYTNVIIPNKDGEFVTKNQSLGKYEIIGYLTDITTRRNPLSNNPREDPNASIATTNHSNSDNNSSNNSSGNTTTTVVVEQHGPVQVWVPCGGCQLEPGRCTYCHGSGWGYNDRLCSRCGGNGKCTICGGNGGHYEVQYR